MYKNNKDKFILHCTFSIKSIRSKTHMRLFDLCATSKTISSRYSKLYVLFRSRVPTQPQRFKHDFRHSTDEHGVGRVRGWGGGGQVQVEDGGVPQSLQGCTLNDSSSSECMLLSERSSGSFSSSLVKVVADSSPWFCATRFRRAQISWSCRASSESRSWIPERSGPEHREGVNAAEPYVFWHNVPV